MKIIPITNYQYKNDSVPRNQQSFGMDLKFEENLTKRILKHELTIDTLKRLEVLKKKINSIKPKNKAVYLEWNKETSRLKFHTHTPSNRELSIIPKKEHAIIDEIYRENSGFSVTDIKFNTSTLKNLVKKLGKKLIFLTPARVEGPSVSPVIVTLKDVISAEKRLKEYDDTAKKLLYT